MTPKWKRRLKRALLVVLLAIVVALVLLALLAWTGLDERWARSAIVAQLEKSTGARVELGAFHFRLFGLRAELDDLTLHGLEPEGTPPLFHADRVRLSVRIVSFFGRRIALEELLIDRPSVDVRVDASGRSNVPSPKVGQDTRPWRERLFDLSIRRLQLEDGSLLFNDVRAPLAAEGENFRFALDFNAPAPGKETYAGTLGWQQMELAARRYLPFRSDVSAKFTLRHDAFELDELRWKLPHSEIQVRAELPTFRQSDWNFRYRVRLSLAELREILRKPHMPEGDVEFSGDGAFAAGMWSANGHYTAREFVLPYVWFHAGGLASNGRFALAKQRLELPQFEASALGGALQGRLEMDFRNLAFRVNSQMRGASLAALLAAVDNPNFPLHTLHWDGTVDVDAVTTWTADFKHLRAQGESRWSPPARAIPGKIPVTARLDFDYVMDRRGAVLTKSEILTPNSQLEMDGTLSADDSALEVQLDARNLFDWDDFINYLRGSGAEPRVIAGRATWQGRVLGPLTGPTFAGHVHAFDPRYGRLDWSEIEGELAYSPDELRLERTRVRRGRSTGLLDLWLKLDGAWSFLPDNPWSLSVKIDRAPVEDIQGLFNTDFPVHGLLSGDFRGSGTHASPQFAGSFDLAEGKAWKFPFERARGQIALGHGEVRLSGAEVSLDSGRITGDLVYRLPDGAVEFSLVGASIPLERISRLQSRALPLGGQLNFDLRGSGPLLAPTARGTLRLVNLRAGDEVLGSFDGQLDSDGRRVRVALDSVMTAGRLQGQLELGLSGDYPLSGELNMEGIDLDPFIEAGLHLKALTGHSRVDGRFAFSGAVARPDTILVQADITRVSLDFEYVKLENNGPLRLSYRRNEVRIEQANLRGPDTDLSLSGYARFAGDRALSLNLAGTVNLRLLTGLLPGLEARGAAQVNAAVEGTYSNPRITGKARVADAAANYGDFPAGLSHVKGEFVFDRSRLLFENVTAEAGGGKLTLSGSLSYGEGPLRYEVTAAAARVRIRYPEGLSWLAGGTLRLSGTTQAGLLSGNVIVERLLMGEGMDLASLMLASRGPVSGPATSSPFLRNLQFDIEADSSPNARMEWTGAHFETEGSLRVRGTWEHPVLLGHIHLLAGELSFRGNRYQLNRGDINFSNPFRLDPVLNVEATTTIHQYEITLDLSGPASHLNLAYRSDPPLPAGDVIALLALGSTSEESALRSSTSAQTQGYGATALLSEAISSQLGGRIERLFGISRFRVDPFLAGTTTEQNAAARITIEQQVTRELTITYSTNATANQEQVIQVEYAVRREFSIVALRDNNGTFGLDIKFKKRFK